MLSVSPARILKTKNAPAAALVLVLAALLVGVAIAAQDKYTLHVPNGLAFSEVEGYDTWQGVAVSETEGSVKAILANPPKDSPTRTDGFLPSLITMPRPTRLSLP